MEKTSVNLGIEYWMRWQVPVCGLVFVIPAVVSLLHISRSRSRRDPINPNHLWLPCWKNLNPRYLLLYRAFAFASMAFLLYQTVATFGFFVFFFYTQWTFALVMVYFALGTIVSARGCLLYSKESNASQSSTTFKGNEPGNSLNLQGHNIRSQIDQRAGILEKLMQSIYQTCAGAVMLTDIVFWCLLLPFMTGDNFSLTLLIGCMHSLNAVFLLLDSALNSLLFPWHRLTDFVLWSASYITFQWVVHACGIPWWPYPFLELANPWAPMWYFGMALIHLPCYGLYALLMKAKASMFSKLFPHAFLRDTADKKQN